MGKYFGTDGFRGEANCTLTADHAFKVGRFLGWYYTQLKHQNNDSSPARIVIGKDTCIRPLSAASRAAFPGQSGPY